jgi:hypothetical protein
MLESW